MGNKLTRRRAVVDERYTRTQGLYQHTGFDARKLRRLILSGQLAPCYPGAEDCAIELDECPICFLYYPSLNRSKCCTKGICTECFLQVKSPNSSRSTQCPFCKTSSYVVEYRGAKTVEEKGVEQAEEQKVIEAKIRIRQKELQDEEERMLRREEIQGEDNVPDRFRRNFSNLHGFTLPTNEVEMHGQTSSHEQSLNTLNVSDSTIQQVQSCQAELTSDEVAACERGSEPPSEGTISIPGPTVRPSGSSFHRISRADHFDLDLEEIMVMEAIWLSIQDQSQFQQEGQHGLVEGANNHLRNTVNAAGICDSFQDNGRTSAMGGLAGAIAALAERQQAATVSSSTLESQAGCPAVAPEQLMVSHGGSSVDASRIDGTTTLGLHETFRSNGTTALGLCESSDYDGVSTLITPTMTSDNVQEAPGTELKVQQEHHEEKGLLEEERPQVQDGDGVQELNNWIEVSIESGRAISPLVRRESRGSLMSDWMLDHSSEAVEVGTSFSSSVPSASDLPWEGPDFLAPQSTDEIPAGGQPLAMLPDSYEEQMMLAMALSLAEAQAQAWQH